MSADARPRLLILSFSRIESDARVLKQVRHFATQYRVTTCGYGAAPDDVVEHLRIPDEAVLGSPYRRLLQLRLYTRAYAGLRPVRWIRENLRGSGRQWDAVLANDVESLPVALELAPAARVHADLHEYSPRMREEDLAWKKAMRPFLEWICRRHVARAASWTTVGRALATEYDRNFGIKPEVVRNATTFRDSSPTPPRVPLRLVHSGGGMRRRSLEATIEAMSLVTADVELDMYLMPNDPAYIKELRELADATGRTRVLDPVPHDELITTLQQYDVGVFLLPPVNFNYRSALPNKLFDFVQARLATVVSPNEEMASLVRDHRLGLVTRDYSARALADAIDELTPESVSEYKDAADAAARELSAEKEIAIWDAAIRSLITPR